MIRVFVPLLAGATLRDRLLACAGAGLGVFLTGLLTWLLVRELPGLPLIAAPIGASAVLVFAVPSSPLAQPWPVIGGNMVSAVIGIAVAAVVPAAPLAAGIAVGVAILVMSLLRCLHPPGGAVALMAAVGGPSVAAAGLLFPLVPVGLNAVLLTLCGVGFHRLSRHSYPHHAAAAVPPSPTLVLPRPEDIAAALDELGEAFDIGAEDLAVLVERANRIAAARPGGLAASDPVPGDADP